MRTHKQLLIATITLLLMGCQTPKPAEPSGSAQKSLHSEPDAASQLERGAHTSSYAGQWQKCPACYGKGGDDCGWCGGDGVKNDGTYCKFCSKTGWIQCWRCKGKGRI